MNQSINDLKGSFTKIFLEQKEALKKALTFYQSMEENIPSEEHWKLNQESPVFNSLIGVIDVKKTVMPSKILETAIETIEEYLEAFENFSADQFAAFLLGLGLRWIPFEYWGLNNLSDYYGRLQKELAFYEKIEANIPEEEHWKIKKRNPFNAIDLSPPDKIFHSELISNALTMVEIMLKVLADRPF